MSRQPISQATLLEDPDLSVDKLRSIGSMFENQCAQFVGCLYGSALNRGLDPFYANGNLAGSAFKKAGRSLRKWMADGSVYVALHQGATEPSKLPPFCPSADRFAFPSSRDLKNSCITSGLTAHARG